MNPNAKNYAREFEPWMLDIVKDHLLLGGSMTSLSGQLKMTPECWMEHVKTVPELMELNTSYKQTIRHRMRFKIARHL